MNKKWCEQGLIHFEQVCVNHIVLVYHVKDTMFIIHLERFIIALTNRVMHFENTTSNKYETYIIKTHYFKLHMLVIILLSFVCISY